MPKTVNIAPEVRAVLELATVEGTPDRPVVKLNAPDLDRALYTAVDKVLRAAGGKWDRRAGGHLFDRPLDINIAGWLAAGLVVDRKRTAEQFFTPPALAARMVDLAGLRANSHVLEPSAGMGALADAAYGRAGFLTLVEQDDDLAHRLLERFGGKHGIGIWRADFMQWIPRAAAPIDTVLMNPPFSRNQDIAHVERAFGFLTVGGCLVAIMSQHFIFAGDGPSRGFRELIGAPSLSPAAFKGGELVPVEFAAGSIHSVIELLPPDTFKSEGTAVSAALVILRKGN